MSDLPDLTDFLHSSTFVAFDTETTGLLAISHRIVELAAIKFRLESEPAEVFENLINPGMTMPAEVIKIHGITDDMVANSPSAPEIMRRFVDFCGPDSILIAHNAPFDISFLATELKRADMIFGRNPVIDTVDIYRRLYPELPGYALLALATAFGFADTQEHRALSDARLVQRLFQKASSKLPPIESVADLSNHLSVYQIDTFLGEVDRLPERFADITRAIEENIRLEIEYTKPGESPHSRVIRPGGLAKMNGTIYLTAYCELAQAERTFRLDRISRFRLLSE